MNHRTETEGTLVPLRYLRLVGITLLPENHHDDNGCAGHQQDADDTECHSAGIAGLLQIKTAGIDDFQRNDGISCCRQWRMRSAGGAPDGAEAYS